MLNKMWEMQRELNERVNVPYAPENAEDRQDWTMQYIRCMQQELAELTDCFPWKHWKYDQVENRQNAQVEVVDLFHFLISIAQTLGMSAEDVYLAYCQKMAINHERQDTGYVGKPDDCLYVGYKVVQRDISTHEGEDYLFNVYSPTQECVATVPLFAIAAFLGTTMQGALNDMATGAFLPTAENLIKIARGIS